MTTQTADTGKSTDAPDQSGRGPGGRHRSTTLIIAGSLALGIATALLLTLVVFPGATESTMTGSLLLAFGLGWAAMAALSVRYTDQAQRWAAVPAVVMGLSGLALLIGSPEQATLALVSWVWPPVMVTLAVWMFVQMRRHLTGRGRWLLTPVLVFLAVCGIGAMVEKVTVLRDHDAYPAPGKTYEVAGRTLHLDCHGQGGPTVVLFNGLGEISATWARISDPVAFSTTRVCAYDRAGQAWSDDAPSPQDGNQAAADLHAVLTEAGEHGPFVLVGHSIGGLYAMTYAAQYPSQVAGMVLLDSTSPQQFAAIPAYPSQYAVMRRGYALLTTLARMGTGHLTASTSVTGKAGDQVRAMNSTPRAARNVRDELTTLPTTMEESQRLTSLHGAPLVVLTASESLEHDGWDAAQDRIAELSDNVVHRDVTSSHMGLVDDRHSTHESVRAVIDAVTAARTRQPLTTP